MTFYGSIGYAFASSEWRYIFGLNRRFFRTRHIDTAVVAYDLTETDDRWIIPTAENSWAAFLFHEDFHDFYRRRGFSAYAKMRAIRGATITFGYRNERHTTLTSRAKFSVFGGRSAFRNNPDADEGRMAFLFAHFLSGVSDSPAGWRFELGLEYRSSLFPDDFEDFTRTVLDLRRYQPVGEGERLRARLRYGWITGTPPAQFLFDLGGISTLRGYPFKEFVDDSRLLLLNIEYHIERSAVANPLVKGFLEELALILFADAGAVWSDGTFIPERGDIYRDVGIGLAGIDDYWRVDVAWPWDGGLGGAVVTFRISRPF